MWMLGALALAVAIVALVALRRRTAGPDLGTVSSQWLIEYRQSQES